MAEEKVTLPVDTPGLSQAEEGFKSLRLQVREAKLELERLDSQGKRNSEAYKEAAKKLDDLQDSAARIGFQSKQLTDKFAALPGPLGAVGRSINGVKESFETFGKGLTVGLGVVGLVVSAFFAMKKALESTKEGQETLNRVSQAFSAILGPILATVEKVAVPVFETLASVLETVATGFNKFARLIGISQEKIKETTIAAKDGMKEAVDEANKIIEKAELSLLNERQRKLKERELQFIEEKKKLQAAGITDFTTLEKAYREDIADINKEADDKARKDQQGDIDKKKKIQEDANKILTEAELSLLSDRDRELRERDIRFEEEKKALKLAGVKDLSKFEAEYRKDVAAINKKFDDNEAKAADDKAKKAEDDRKKGLEKALADEKLALDLKKSQGLLSEQEYQTALYEIKKKYAVDAAALTQVEIDNNNRVREDDKKTLEERKKDLDEQITALQQDYEYKKSLGIATFADQLANFDQVRALQKQKLIEEKATQDQLVAFDKETAAKRTEIERAATETKLAVISGALGTIADAVGRNTVAGKALAVAQATVDTYVGANKALATYPPPFGAIAAGTVILAGLLNVKKILSTKVPAPPGTKGVGGGGGGGSTPSAPPTPAFTVPTSFTAPQIGATVGQQGTIAGIVAGSIQANQSTSQPIRAYVVGNEIRTNAQLERRTRTMARLGG